MAPALGELEDTSLSGVPEGKIPVDISEHIPLKQDVIPFYRFVEALPADISLS